jgi:hypothetical protein
MSGTTETDEVPVRVRSETGKAFELEDKESGGVAWFPKSQIHFERRNVKTGDAVAVIPLWLLKGKGWS